MSNSKAPKGPRPLIPMQTEAASYPVEALGPLREVVEAVQGATQAPLALPAGSALAAAALLVQGHADIETLDGMRPTSLFVLTIGQSGERKTSSDSKLMTPILRHEREHSAEYRQKITKWEFEKEIWEGNRNQIVKLMKSENREKHAEGQADFDAIRAAPTAPPSSERIVSEPTYEGLVRLYSTGMPSLGLFSDEGGQFLGGYSMSKENKQRTVAAFNDLWQGKPIKRTRSGDGHTTFHGRRFSLHLMIQPGVAQKLLTDPTAEDTGFLGRCLISHPTRPWTHNALIQMRVAASFTAARKFSGFLS